MVNVQVEDGHVRIANSLYEALYRLRIPGRHKDVIACVIRFTYGYQKTRDTIAISQIAAATEIDERGVRRLLVDLVEWGVIGREPTGPGRPPSWWVVKDFEAWNPAGTGHAKRLSTLKDRAQSPGRRAPIDRRQKGADARAQSPGSTAPTEGEEGEEPRAQSPRTQGAEPLQTPGAEPPLQRHKNNTKDSVGADAPPPHPEPDISKLKNYIQDGSIPKGLNGQTWPTRDAWFEHHTPKIIAEAEGRARERAMRAGDIERWPEFFGGEAKKLVIAYWNHKTPRVTTTKRRTQTPGVGQWQNG